MKLRKLVGMLCILFGLSFIVPHLLFIPEKLDIIHNGTYTTGEVIKKCEEETEKIFFCKIFIFYRDDQQKPHRIWTVEESFISNTKQGDKIKIYYNESTGPIVVDNFFSKYIGSTDILLGLLVLFTGIYILYNCIEKRNIKKNGIRLKTKITKIGKIENYSNIWRLGNPKGTKFIIQSEYKENGKTYIFKSGTFQFIGNKFLNKHKVGDTVQVYVKENNYKKYIMDIPEI